MTNRSSFTLENKGHACYFVGAWLSNFCHDFINPLGTFSCKWRLYEDKKKFWGQKVRIKWQPGENMV